MATTLQLSDIRTQILQRIDRMQNQSTPSPFFTTSELNSMVNASLWELYDILINAYGDDYFVTVPAYTFITDGNTDIYTLPSDFYKFRGLDLQIAGQNNSWIPIMPFNMQ